MHNLETSKKDRAIPCCSCIYTLSKISGKCNRDITEREFQKCLKDCVVFEGSGCYYETLDQVLSFKGETKRVKTNY